MLEIIPVPFDLEAAPAVPVHAGDVPAPAAAAGETVEEAGEPRRRRRRSSASG